MRYTLLKVHYLAASIVSILPDILQFICYQSALIGCFRCINSFWIYIYISPYNVIQLLPIRNRVKMMVMIVLLLATHFFYHVEHC